MLAETALYLGAGIADLINLFSPDRIILGGWAGLLLGQHMLPAIRASAREHALSHPFDQTTITVGQAGPGRGRARCGHAAHPGLPERHRGAGRIQHRRPGPVRRAGYSTAGRGR